MLVHRSPVATAVLAAVLLAGCTDPDLPTDLRRDGPPNVTTVLVKTDFTTSSDPGSSGTGPLVEEATYCRVADSKRPGLVGLPDARTLQVCPDDLSLPADKAGVAEAAPAEWWIRIVFDRLLDPSIEDLVPENDASGNPTDIIVGTLKNTRPVTLTCNGVTVDYDGYYVPNGNRSSWELGPALFIAPSFPKIGMEITPIPVPPGASCSVSIKDNVHSKSGDPVPGDQRAYQFKVAAMSFQFSNPDPADAEEGKILLLDAVVPVDYFFTAALKIGTTEGTGSNRVDLPTLDPAQVQIFSAPNIDNPNDPNGDADPAVCNGGGSPVASSRIRAVIRGQVVTSTALVMRLGLNNGVNPTQPSWDARTTYRVQFGPDARVAARQGGEDAALPTDYQLCFHTTAAASN